MDRYDPLIDPHPEVWLALDEGERIALVEDYHKRTGDRFPRRHLHATIHTVAETQLAMGLPEVAAALKRLMAEGLDRHQAVHAISTVIMEHIHDMLSARHEFDPEVYNRSLAELTADKWWAMAEPEKPTARVIRPGGRRRHKRR